MSHVFVPDPIGHANHTGPIPCRWCPCAECPLPSGNAVHELPDTAEAQQEHIRRGDQAEYDRRQALRWSVNSGGGEGDSTGAVGAVGRVEA